jgi:altronate hydrolase
MQATNSCIIDAVQYRAGTIMTDTSEATISPAASTQPMLQGYLRSDGRKGIRNVVAVAYLVECAHHVAREIVTQFREPLDAFDDPAPSVSRPFI